ncbi:LLM class flavin-dependent oxidoreductase [Pseudonocardia xishanensis]|uniref:LLM class flavin-dependent oxidoreductase n=1 Tax=Pseudonocardia xishanensis TaxID=630995 RepID=A0ABP8S1T2_9PSEU
MLSLMTTLGGLGSHLGGWRHPRAWTGTAMNLDQQIELARIAERGLFDLLFLADGNAVRQMDKPALFEAVSFSDRPTGFEPVTLMAALAQHTSRIGLLATATTTYEQPWTLARKFASLDHLSGGRACWNIVTSSYPGDSRNFGREDHVPRGERYARASEFVEVCKGLWDSWAPDAFPEDKDSGRYLRADRVRTLDHHGVHFDVAGPLNVARMPQGYPVLFHAGQSEPGRELAARHADCVFSVSGDIKVGRDFATDMRQRAVRHGRAASDIRIYPGATAYVAQSMAEADELFEELQSLISPSVGVPYLSKLVEEDLSGYPVDGPLPDLSGEVSGLSSFRTTIAAMAERDGLTIRETYERVLPTMGHVLFKGTATDVADQMQEWHDSGAADGFLLSAPALPFGLESIVDLLVPELQRRGLYRTAYTGSTLRENLGLPIPRNPHFDLALSGTEQS